jgi:hypothetical protein
MSEAAPVEYMIVAFPGNQFKGEIIPALADLVESETIRIIDLAMVTKDSNGEVAGFELADLDPRPWSRPGPRPGGCSTMTT